MAISGPSPAEGARRPNLGQRPVYRRPAPWGGAPHHPAAGVVNFPLRSLHLSSSLWLAGSNSVIPALALVDVWGESQ